MLGSVQNNILDMEGLMASGKNAEIVVHGLILEQR